MYKIQASIVRKYPAVFVLLCTHLFFTHSSFVGKVVLTLEYIEEDCFLRGVYGSSAATMGNFPHPSLHGKLDYEAAFGSRSSLLQKPICRHKRRQGGSEGTILFSQAGSSAGVQQKTLPIFIFSTKRYQIYYTESFLIAHLRIFQVCPSYSTKATLEALSFLEYLQNPTQGK